MLEFDRNGKEIILNRCTDEWADKLNDILKKVDSIADNALGYSSVKTLIIPNNIIDIGNEACRFGKFKFVQLSSKIKIIPYQCFNQCQDLEEVIIPEGVEEIGAFAFLNCEKLTKIHLPSSIKFIGEGAFLGSGIKELEVPKNAIVRPQGDKIVITRTGLTTEDLIRIMIENYKKNSKERENSDIDKYAIGYLERELIKCEKSKKPNNIENTDNSQAAVEQ